MIVNSPHNPTGRIYGSEELQSLAAMLTRASQRIGHDIALLSDEAYVRIAFDGAKPESPAAYYPHTFVLYSYGKQLLAPGQRVGYIALPPSMPGRETLREAHPDRAVRVRLRVPECAAAARAAGARAALHLDRGPRAAARPHAVRARELGYEALRPRDVLHASRARRSKTTSRSATGSPTTIRS